MSTQTILHPVIALLLLSCVMFFWMYATRVPAILKSGMKMDPQVPSGDLMKQLPARVRWKADNYNHLLEQPTMFYAVALTLALLDAGNGLNTALAWCYVGMRVVHTLVQTMGNVIMLRFGVFVFGSLFLVALVVRAAMLIWG